MKSTLVVITGPTGVGKSSLALEIASWFKTEIISADSRQIYKEMRIGTAVPEEKELQQIRHHFIQTHSIHEIYNAGKYELDVISLLQKLFEKFSVVLLTGGSMLYVDAVCKGIDDLPSVDPEIRKSLTLKFKTEGIESLRFQLKKLDPAYYREVDLHNPKRLLHALEMCIISGKPYSSLRTHPRKERPFQIIKIGLTADRQILYDRINRRVDQMVLAGLEEEAKLLYPFRSIQALQTVGYREWFDFFDGNSSRETTIDQIKSNTRLYARKQLTWFKKDPEISWFDIDERTKIIPFIEEKIDMLQADKQK